MHQSFGIVHLVVADLENLHGVGMRFQIISYWIYADGVDEIHPKGYITKTVMLVRGCIFHILPPLLNLFPKTSNIFSLYSILNYEILLRNNVYS